MKLLIAISHDGQFSILKKFYDPKSEKYSGMDQFLDEDIINFDTSDETLYGKVFLARVSSVPSGESDGSYELVIDLDLEKEVFDSNRVALGLDQKPCIKCQKEIEWNEYSTNWEYCSDCFNGILKEH